MVVKVRVKKVYPLFKGVSRMGTEWQKKTFVGETIDIHPKMMCFNIIGESVINSISVEEGKAYDVNFDIESRMYNGSDGSERWSTELKAHNLQYDEATTNKIYAASNYELPSKVPASVPQLQPVQQAPVQSAPAPSEELPF